MKVYYLIIICCARICFGLNQSYIGCFAKYKNYAGEGSETGYYGISALACIQNCGELSAFIRGSECLCFSSPSELLRIDDRYCTIEEDGVYKGGNFAGSLYSKELHTGEINPNFDTTPVKFDYKYESQLDCPSFDHSPTTAHFCDYFPNNNPGDCAALCYFLNNSFAILGYTKVQNRNDTLPVCACENTIRVVETSEEKARCPGDLNSFCGSKNNISIGSAYEFRPDSGEGLPTPSCDHGSCGDFGCSFDNVCVLFRSISFESEQDDLQVLADIYCNSSFSEGHLASLETREKQDFLIEKFSDHINTLNVKEMITSGYSISCERNTFEWEPWNVEDDKVVNESIPDSFIIDDSIAGQTCFIWLLTRNNSWNATRNPGFLGSSSSVYFFCQHPEKLFSTTSQATSSSTTDGTEPVTVTTSETPTVPPGNCLCQATGLYGEPDYTLWSRLSKVWDCPPGYVGSIQSRCVENDNGCEFSPLLPDYKNCTSFWISDIKDNITNGNNALDIISEVKENIDEELYFGHEIEDIIKIVEDIAVLQSNQSTNETIDDRLKKQENITKGANEVLDSILQKDRGWQQIDGQVKTNASTELINAIEIVGFVLSKVAEDTGHCSNYVYDAHNSTDTEMSLLFRVFAFLRNDTDDSIVYRPPSSPSSSLSVSGITQITDLACLQMVGFFISGQKVPDLYPASRIPMLSLRKNNLVTNSDLIGFSLGSSQTINRLKNTNGELKVEIMVKNKIAADYPIQEVIHNCGNGYPTVIPDSQICSFWNEDSQLWESDGCEVDLSRSNLTHTMCICNHLTAFGNIMGLHDYQCWPASLDVITIVAEVFSVICLILTLGIHGILRFVHGEARGSSERGAVLLQISFWLATSHILILFFMNKNWIQLSEELCIAVAIVLHLSLLVSFGWMLVEGILLYRMVVIVFDYDPNVKLYNMIVGYGLPIVIVGITVGAAAGTGSIKNGYSNLEQCWLNRHNGFIWAFNAPVIFIALVNLVILVMALHIAASSTKSPEENSTFTRRWVKGSLALVFIMGITWMFGMLTFIPDIWPLYLFGTLNGLQGVFIFIFQCMLNERVVTKIKRAVSRSKPYSDLRNTSSKVKRDTTTANHRRQTLVSRVPSNSSGGKNSLRNQATDNTKDKQGFEKQDQTISTPEIDIRRGSYNMAYCESTSSSSVPSSGSSPELSGGEPYQRRYQNLCADT
ncbi:adhesion G protein-coupled receptor L1-like isoform X2 [Artemia franciscana]|uniref:Uncharacterized protein n=1 Tax=Artemia franciscana TaxID=6661 RepID=A0AA88L7I9_ARTSF|nr:hypothetical protein QYM36_005330 [Artemia franciscana]